MSVQLVREYLEGYGLADRIKEFDVSSATVDLAAEAVGVIPAKISKTLSFLVGDECILIGMAGDAKVDNRKFKDLFHVKAKMLSPQEVVEFTGHAIGGVCPFAINNDKVKVYMDISMKRFDKIYPAAGSAASAVELTCEELEKASKSLGWIDVCKGWQEEE